MILIRNKLNNNDHFKYGDINRINSLHRIILEEIMNGEYLTQE